MSKLKNLFFMYFLFCSPIDIHHSESFHKLLFRVQESKIGKLVPLQCGIWKCYRCHKREDLLFRVGIGIFVYELPDFLQKILGISEKYVFFYLRNHDL